MSSQNPFSPKEKPPRQPVLDVIHQRLKPLNKKMNRIKEIENKKREGEKINDDQENLVSKKPELTIQIELLESLKEPLGSAVDQEIILDGVKKGKWDGSIEIIVRDLLNLIYLGSECHIITQDQFKSRVSKKRKERDDFKDLGDDLDLISELGLRLMSRPMGSDVSHKAAIDDCLRHAKLWLESSKEPIEKQGTTSYAGVREKLEKIIQLDFFTTARAPSVSSPKKRQKGATSEKARAKRGAQYSLDEDIALCTAYVMITLDSVVGTNQSNTRFWDRVHEKFCSLFPNCNNRTAHGLNNRFGVMSPEITKFVNCCMYHYRHPPSGLPPHNEATILYLGRADYTNRYGKGFQFEEQYNILQQVPKFNYKIVDMQTTQTVMNEDLGSTPLNEDLGSTPGTPHSDGPQFYVPEAVQTTSTGGSHSVDYTAWPPGTKTTKRAKRAAGSTSSVETAMQESTKSLCSLLKEGSERREMARMEEKQKLDEFVRLREESVRLVEEEMSLRRQEKDDRQAKLALKLREEDDRVMAMNISSLDEDTQAYWRFRKREVMERRGLIPRMDRH